MTDGRLHHVVLGRHNFPRMKCGVIPRARRRSNGSAWGHRILRMRVRDEVGHRVPRMRVRGEPARSVAPSRRVRGALYPRMRVRI